MRDPADMTRKKLEAELLRWRRIVSSAYWDRTGALFICGRSGGRDENGLPDAVEICPAYGVGWSVIYRRTDRTTPTEGS